MRKRKRIFPAITFLLLVFLFSACASDPKKPSSVLTQVTRIKEVLSEISDAYGKRDAPGFIDQLDASSKMLGPIREEIVQAFDHFSEADLSFVIRRVEFKETSIMTVVRWHGSWRLDSSSSPIEQEGDALLFWKDSKDPKLTEIRGDSPFLSFEEEQS